jgi:hypothetical protein
MRSTLPAGANRNGLGCGRNRRAADAQYSAIIDDGEPGRWAERLGVRSGSKAQLAIKKAGTLLEEYPPLFV